MVWCQSRKLWPTRVTRSVGSIPIPSAIFGCSPAGRGTCLENSWGLKAFGGSSPSATAKFR